jgi:hypothetical protein
MKRATSEETNLSSDPEKCEILFAGDGSWKIHGHMSHHSIVSVIGGAETGTVIDVDVEVMSS